MSTLTTTRPIDLLQLGAELGTHDLSAMGADGECTITCHDEAITQAELEAAVDAHVPAPPPPSAYERLQDQFNELLDFLIDIGVI